MNSRAKPEKRLRIRRRDIAVCAGIIFTSTLSAQESRPASPQAKRMNDLAKAFADLEKALANREVQCIVDSSERIAASSKHVAKWKLFADKEGAQALASSLSTEADAVRAAAHASNLPLAGTAAERMRRACITCHIQFRPKNEDRRLFPGHGNTIWGKVTITSKGSTKRDIARDAVVFIDEVSKTPPLRFPIERPSVSQRGARFSPNVLPISKGTIVEFPNDDRIFHNVFSLSKTRPFDLGVYGKGKSRRVEFTKTGLVRIYCNIHAKMSCTILVLQNRYFGVSDATGTYVITGVPDGEYNLRPWHGLGNAKGTTVRLREGSLVRADFVVQASRRVRAHKNKFGKPYSSKY